MAGSRGKGQIPRHYSHFLRRKHLLLLLVLNMELQLNLRMLIILELRLDVERLCAFLLLHKPRPLAALCILKERPCRVGLFNDVRRHVGVAVGLHFP
jgi:hypothetical protein